MIVTSLTSSSCSSWRRTGRSLTSSKPAHPFPGSSSRRTTTSSSVPVVGGKLVSFGVSVRINQRSEEELEEGDNAPEEVCYGVKAPGFGLQDPTIRGDVDHCCHSPGSRYLSLFSGKKRSSVSRRTGFQSLFNGHSGSLKVSVERWLTNPDTDMKQGLLSPL